MRFTARSYFRGALALCSLTAIDTALPSSASGATYAVYSCQTPGGAAIGGDGWQRASVTTATSVLLSLDCRSGGLRFTSGATTHARGVELGIEFRPAAETTVVGLRLKHSVFVPGEQTNAWGWEYALSAVDAETGQRFRWATCVSPLTSCANYTSYELEGEHTWGRRMSKVQVTAVCSTMAAGNCPSSPAASVAVTSSAFTIEDRSQPEIVEPPTGSLIDASAPITGLAQVLVKAHDDGGGLLTAAIEVDGVPVATESFDKGSGRCIPPFSNPMPCPADASKLLSFDSSTVADGTHSVVVRVTDATGRNSATAGPWTVVTRNSPPAAQPVNAPPSCAAHLMRGLRLVVSPTVLRGSGRVTLKGQVPRRLRDGVTRVILFGDAPEGIRHEVVPSRRGRFRARVAVHVAQKIRAAAMGAAAEPLGCSKARSIRIRARTTLSASRRRLANGQALELSGSVVTRPIPTGGKIVRVKVRAAGSKRWYSAGEIRSDLDGAWSWRHRFTKTLRPTTYVFRVVLPKQKQYPYARGVSRTLSVRVGR
jgi:hypothetical protein